MLETTPASSQSQNSRLNAHLNSRQSNRSHHTAAGVDLAPVAISPSPLLWRLELSLYGALVFFAAVAILPFIHTAFYWPIILLGFVLLVIAALRTAWRKQHAAPLRLSVIQGVWRLATANGELEVLPCDEILMWEMVMVIPLREQLTQRKHWLVALPDAMNASDWRRLRVWLRMGLRNNL